MREAMFTVSPYMSLAIRMPPITPATTGPACMPMRRDMHWESCWETRSYTQAPLHLREVQGLRDADYRDVSFWVAPPLA